MPIRYIVTVDYGHFSCRHNSRTVLSNQNVCANELNIVLFCAFRSNEFKIVTKQIHRTNRPNKSTEQVDQTKQTNPPNKSTEQNPLRQNEVCMKFDSVTGVLNPFNEVWCDNKKIELPIRHSTSKTRFFFIIRCHEMWYDTTKTWFLASIPILTLLVLCYLTVSRMTLIWHFRGGWVLQKVDINLLVLEAF